MAGEITGKNAAIRFGGSTFSQDYRSFDVTEECGTVDASAGSDNARSYLPTLVDGKASMEWVYTTNSAALWSAVAPGTTGTLEWGPEGTSSAGGVPKYTASAIVTSRQRTHPFEDLVIATTEWQFNSSVTASTY
jgi:hypothetical protein